MPHNPATLYTDWRRLHSVRPQRLFALWYTVLVLAALSAAGAPWTPRPQAEAHTTDPAKNESGVDVEMLKKLYEKGTSGIRGWAGC